MTVVDQSEEGTLFRVQDPKEGRPTLAIRDGDDIVAVPGTIRQLHDRHRAGAPLPRGRRLAGVGESISLLPPVSPSKIVCVGLNYRHHAAEMNKTVPTDPLMFMKPPSALVATGDAIEIPEQSSEVHHEGELVVVVGRRLKNGDQQQAADAIFGYTCGCDITARDIQRRENRYTRSKGFDTFAPVGPSIALAPEYNPSEHRLTCRVDGEVRQQSTLDDFIFSIEHVVSFISHVMTLEAGDLLFTGTPSGVAPVEPGQKTRVEIEGIGTLENPVVG